MRITEETVDVTVGTLASFLAHALANGVPLEATIEMRRDRRGNVVQLAIDVPLPAFGTPAAAASALRERPRRGRVSPPEEPATVPPSDGHTHPGGE